MIDHLEPMEANVASKRFHNLKLFNTFNNNNIDLYYQ